MPRLPAFSGAAENSESGATPERYRHCMRGDAAQGESRSLGKFPEKAVWCCGCVSQETCLSVIILLPPRLGADGCCESAEKRPRRSREGVAAVVLLLLPGNAVPPSDSPRKMWLIAQEPQTHNPDAGFAQPASGYHHFSEKEDDVR